MDNQQINNTFVILIIYYILINFKKFKFYLIIVKFIRFYKILLDFYKIIVIYIKFSIMKFYKILLDFTLKLIKILN